MSELPMAVCNDPFARALDTLAVDSDFDTGQKPPLAFFFVEWLVSLEVSFCVRVTVEPEELVEERDEEELLLWTVLRCGRNMRDTSSVLIAEKPPPATPIPFQLSLEIF
jgi:hypothetical protein